MHIVIVVSAAFLLTTDLHGLLLVFDKLQDFLLTAIRQTSWFLILHNVKNKLVFD